MQLELSSLQGAVEKLRITSTLSIGLKNNDFVFMKNNEAVGFLRLGEEAVLFGATYAVIKMIYLTPSIRKTRAAGAFLTGLKKLLPLPLILGSDKFGGVLYNQGAKLVQALNTPARSHVSVLDLKTGEKREMGDDIPFRPSNLTLVFEDCDVPLLCSEAKTAGGMQLLYNGAPTNYLFEGAEERPFSIDGKL